MDDAAFREAYQRHKDVLYRFARRMLGSAAEAEDVVQDTFLLLWRRNAVHSPERGTLRAFLIGITRNLILMRLRAQRRYDELDEDGACDPPIDVVGLDRARIVERAVTALRPLQREALILAEYEELTVEEIAGVTGSELAAVKSRLHRARENLRRTLAPLMERKVAVDATNT